jgi:hypothetical protein
MTYEAGGTASAPPAGAELAEGLPDSLDRSAATGREPSAAPLPCRGACSVPGVVCTLPVSEEYPVTDRRACGSGYELALWVREGPDLETLQLLASQSDLLAVVKAGLALSAAPVVSAGTLAPSFRKRTRDMANPDNGTATVPAPLTPTKEMLDAGAACVVYATDDESYTTLQDVAADVWQAMLRVHLDKGAGLALNSVGKLPQGG